MLGSGSAHLFSWGCVPAEAGTCCTPSFGAKVRSVACSLIFYRSVSLSGAGRSTISNKHMLIVDIK